MRNNTRLGNTAYYTGTTRKALHGMPEYCSRTSGRSCPYCTGKLPVPSETDLLTLRPDLAKEWDYEKNEKPLIIQPISAHWRACINNRVSQGTGCSYCAGNLPIKGENDLTGRLAIPDETSFAAMHPNTAKQWDYEKNGGLLPTQFTSRSKTSIWWKCDKGHSWLASISSRASGAGCPRCNGQKNRSHRLI